MYDGDALRRTRSEALYCGTIFRRRNESQSSKFVYFVDESRIELGIGIGKLVIVSQNEKTTLRAIYCFDERCGVFVGFFRAIRLDDADYKKRRKRFSPELFPLVAKVDFPSDSAPSREPEPRHKIGMSHLVTQQSGVVGFCDNADARWVVVAMSRTFFFVAEVSRIRFLEHDDRWCGALNRKRGSSELALK